MQSQVWYSNIYVDGHRTHLWNGDRFVYVMQESTSRLGKSVLINGYQARVIKQVALSRCFRCQQLGHKASSPDCPARATPEVQDSIQVFQGGTNPLSNLHVCPEGCTWMVEGIEYNSVEKEFQHNKLLTHDLNDEAAEILNYENPLEIMFHSHELIHDESESWIKMEKMVMDFTCKNKFNNYSHARHVLMRSKADLDEGMMNRKWGSGLNAEQTYECHPDFWPGDNLMGSILRNIRHEMHTTDTDSSVDGSKTLKRKD